MIENPLVFSRQIQMRNTARTILDSAAIDFTKTTARLKHGKGEVAVKVLTAIFLEESPTLEDFLDWFCWLERAVTKTDLKMFNHPGIIKSSLLEVGQSGGRLQQGLLVMLQHLEGFSNSLRLRSC